MITMFKRKQVETTNSIIEEIHETFFTEVDRLLASAKISNSLETTKQDLIDKHNRLISLGFNNTKEVKEARIEIDRINKLKQDNDNKLELIEAINFFSVAYPNYKFITEESVKKICQKYGLVYGEISRYLGTVPDKNLKHIEQFKVLEEHECYEKYTLYMMDNDRRHVSYVTKKEMDIFSDYNNRRSMLNSYYLNYVELCPLEIAAPFKDFDITGLEVKDYQLRKIEVPDPIVLKPVIFKNKKYYLIVTAWGEEANDEIVINEKMN